MYQSLLEESGFYQADGMFWQFLAYCAGTGGSVLIIGSAAGVVAIIRGLGLAGELVAKHG